MNGRELEAAEKLKAAWRLGQASSLLPYVFLLNRKFEFFLYFLCLHKESNKEMHLLWYNISIVLTADSVVTGYAYFCIIRR